MARPTHTDLAGIRARRLRNELTISEARLWPQLRKRATGARFRRQVPIGLWIVDFASLKPKIVVEVDDPSHYWRDEEKRTRDLEGLGFVVLRFSNREVAMELGGVVEIIARTVEESS
ncbi:MAG: endonuclease domain-containing protein [Acidimicrobiia bacterium]|nr:endonuclease domain-containing protein [Acidimicrobiia bacterium]